MSMTEYNRKEERTTYSLNINRVQKSMVRTVYRSSYTLQHLYKLDVLPHLQYGLQKLPLPTVDLDKLDKFRCGSHRLCCVCLFPS